jgi:hypothetical protein
MRERITHFPRRAPMIGTDIRVEFPTGEAPESPSSFPLNSPIALKLAERLESKLIWK